MINFENIDALKNFLQRDKELATLNPIRFVNVNSSTDWHEMKNFLSELTTKIISLSEYCGDDDTLPNLRKFHSELQSERRNVLVLPLAELIRLNPDNAAQEVKRILNLLPNERCAFRFYFLLYGMKDFLLSLNLNDPRQENSLLILSGTQNENYALTIIQKPMPIANLNDDSELVDGVRRYLKCREKSPSTPLILYTKNAVHLQDKKFFDDVKLIANSFDFLRHYYDLPAEFKKNFGQDEDWIKLAEMIATTGSFEKTFFKAFEGKVLAGDCFAKFDPQSKFHRWILWLHCMTQKSGYVAWCAKASSSIEEFISKIYELIFSCTDEENFDELVTERRNFLSVMKTLPPNIFLERIRHVNKKIALKILTSNSHVERRLIFETLQKFLPLKKEIDEAKKILQENFPALANYISDAENYSTAEQTEYFRHYRWLKVTNGITPVFLAMVDRIAQQKSDNNFALPTRNEIVNEEYSSNAAIFFVDGLGAEYLNFLTAEFSALKEKVLVRYKIGRCELPSTTEVNKDFLQGRNVVADLRELDSLKHESRAYPECILSELDFLSALKEKILQELEVYEKIILCADHGTSRLAVLARNKFFDKAFPAEKRKVYKSGRFADALPGDEKKFPTAIEYDDKIIFADYSRFVQKGTTGIEIHGGATLEEILVPVISIERRHERVNRFN